MLCRLWMFRGGFGLEAANAMLSTETPTPVPRLLRDLVDASCLQAAQSPAEAGGGVRYSVHALVGEIFQGQFSRLSGPVQASRSPEFWKCDDWACRPAGQIA